MGRNQIGRSSSDDLTIQLNPDHKYMVGIGDKDFFLLNPLPTFNPRILLSIPEKHGDNIITLKLTRHEKMSDPASLEGNSSLPFSDCIHFKVAEHIGCTSFW